MTITFVDLANDGNNTQSTWIPYALPYAKTLSAAAQIPVNLILAEWIAEGSYLNTSSGAVCNNPGNADYGPYCTGYSSPENCQSYSGEYGAPDAQTGACRQGDILNNAYPEIAQAAAQSTLTSGGQSLYNWAQSNGYGGLKNQTYNAAYQWGAGGACGVWAGSHYCIGYTNCVNGVCQCPTAPYGSYLIELIYDDSLTGYDYIESCP